MVSVKEISIEKPSVKGFAPTAIDAIIDGTIYDSAFMYDVALPYNDANGGASSTDKGQFGAVGFPPDKARLGTVGFPPDKARFGAVGVPPDKARIKEVRGD